MENQAKANTMNTQAQAKTTNRLFFASSKTYKEDGHTYRIRAEVRLDDECKNGHEDFSVTGDIYKVHANGRETWQSGCCIHEEISKHFPQLREFVRLHLCDYRGVPSYPVENGFYHIQNGNRKAVEKLLYCCTSETVDEAMTLKDKDKLFFKSWLESHCLPAKWQAAADQAIASLESLQTGSLEGCKFVSQATKSHYEPMTDGEKALLAGRLESGYYTPDQIKAREVAKIDRVIADSLDWYDKKVKEAQQDKELHAHLYALIRQVSGDDIKAFERIKDNTIIYDHCSAIAFNWKSFATDKVTDEEIAKFTEILPSSTLLSSYTVENKGK